MITYERWFHVVHLYLAIIALYEVFSIHFSQAIALRCAARALLPLAKKRLVGVAFARSIDGDAREIREYARQAMKYGNEAGIDTFSIDFNRFQLISVDFKAFQHCFRLS